MEVIIEPPFWLTWWFKLGAVLIITAGILALYYFRINAIEVQKAQLQQQVLISIKEEKKARQEAENAHQLTELAYEELKLKNKELEQFAYIASHDLQEPLRTTAGFVELIQKQYHGKIDEKADKYLDFITDATNRMRILIKDVLDFSRIGTKAELGTVDCNLKIKNVLKDITVAIQESKAEIEYGELPVIKGYSTEIKLLFQNLVINAIKFRKKDAVPQIRIDAQKMEGF